MMSNDGSEAAMPVETKRALEQYFKTLENKPDQVLKEKQFNEALRNFYRQKWNCPLRPPAINGKPLNLYKLYTAVSSMGGWLKVSNQDRWSDVAEEMGYPDTIALIDNGIKQIYMRYLSKFEEVQTIGDIDEQDSDIFGAKSRSKAYSAFASGECPIALLYRHR